MPSFEHTRRTKACKASNRRGTASKAACTVEILLGYCKEKGASRPDYKYGARCRCSCEGSSPRTKKSLLRNRRPNRCLPSATTSEGRSAGAAARGESGRDRRRGRDPGPNRRRGSRCEGGSIDMITPEVKNAANGRGLLS